MNASPAITSTVTQPDRTVSLQALTHLLNDEGVPAALMEQSSRQIVWASRACQNLTLAQSLPHAIDDRDPLLTFTAPLTLTGARASQNRFTSPLFRTDNTSVKASVDTHTVHALSAERLDKDLVLLRWRLPDRVDAYYQRLLDEREQLFRSSHALTVNEMATTLAHELNQPIATTINMIAGCIRRLEAAESSPAGVVEALHRADRQCTFAADIIARIRNFTVARQPQIRATDLRDVTRDALSLLDGSVESEGIDLQLRTGAEPLIVACDPTLLQQVIINICRNGIEAMQAAHRRAMSLEVDVFACTDGLQIAIRDQGHGLSGEDAEGLYTPFRSRKSGGMGIGLSICRSFIELHQGRFWLTDNSDAGCTAHILLPPARSASVDDFTTEDAIR